MGERHSHCSTLLAVLSDKHAGSAEVCNATSDVGNSLEQALM